MKKIIAVILSLVLVLGSVMFVAGAENEISVYVDGEKLLFDVSPQIINDRTLVPFRLIFEKLGTEVEWAEDSKTASAFATYDMIIEVLCADGLTQENTLKIRNNSSEIEQYIPVDVRPVIIEDRVLIPLRIVADLLGCEVEWDGNTRTVNITKGEETEGYITMYKPEGYKNRVKLENIDAFLEAGWYKEPIRKLYNANKEEEIFPERTVAQKLNERWYEKPVIEVFAADGRILGIDESELEAYLNVGWYKEPVDTYYTVDGRSFVATVEEGKGHIGVDWYTEPVKILYSADGRTLVTLESQVAEQKAVGWYEESELSELRQINPVIIPATINYTVKGYSYSSLSGYVTTIDAGTVVEYLNPDGYKSMKSAKIKLPSGTKCWVPMSAVSVSRKDFTIKDIITSEEREAFVNKMGYKSKTEHLIWVNKQRQSLTWFKGSQGNWKVANIFPVATGKNTTPTPTTVCEYVYKTRWVTDEYVCDPVLALFDGYAIHNQPVGHNGRVLDTTIGRPASAGCIRMLIEDVQTLYQNIPVGTTVVLY